MKFWFFFILGMLTLVTYAQEPGYIQGRVSQNDTILKNVILQNISTKGTSLTDNEGIFSIGASVGDTILFSRMGSVDLIMILDSADLKTAFLEINLKEVINILPEVNISNTPEINAVSLGIIPKKIKQLTQNESRLQTAGDFKWVHLLGILGGSLQIDPILNAINGRTKELKRNILIEQKLRNIAVFEGYTVYLQEELNLSPIEAQRIISLAGEEEKAHQIISENNPERIKFHLLETWVNFKQ